MVSCSACGAILSDLARYCSRCGVELPAHGNNSPIIVNPSEIPPPRRATEDDSYVCSRCDLVLEFAGPGQVPVQSAAGLQQESVDVYVCPKCSAILFFAQNAGRSGR